MFEYMKKQYESLTDSNGPMRAIVKDINDPRGKGRIGVIIPRLMPYVDPNTKSKPSVKQRNIDKEAILNKEVAELITENVNESPYLWVLPCKSLTGNSVAPYVNDSVLIEFEDGDFKKGRVLPYTYPLVSEAGQLSPTVDTASDEFDPTKKPQIREIIRFRDGTVIFYNENPGSKGLFIRTATGYEISIGDNPEVQGILLKTAAGYTVSLDEKNKTISNFTPGGHKSVMCDGGEDGGNKIEITSSSGHVVTMDDDSPKINLSTAGGHKVNLDDDGSKISMESSGGQSSIIDDGAGTVELKNSGGAKVTLIGPSVMLN